MRSQSITPREVAGHYDELDEFYRDVWGDHVHHGLWITGRASADDAVLQLLGRVAQEADLQPGDRLCDAGCGYGAGSRYFADKFGAEVTGLTISTRQHEYAVSALSEHSPTFLLQDWLSNTLPKNTFDVVIAIESLAHMADKDRFFEQAARVLRPQGRLVVCAWLADVEASPWAERRLLAPICREGRLPGLGTEREYRTMLKQHNFAVDAYSDVSTQVARTWTICTRRVIRGMVTNPRYLRYLTSRHSNQRIFALTLPRIWLAYRSGAFRYGIFTATLDE